MRLWPVPALACLAACAAITNTIAPDSRGNAVKGPPPEVGDRCQRATDLMVQKSCLRERDKANAYLKSVNQGDGLCLEPILGADMNNCRARARIEEQDPTAVELHLIDVDPNSSWAPKANQQIWYENAALVDMDLQEKGY
jgi:hypothetical protein